MTQLAPRSPRRPKSFERKLAQLRRNPDANVFILADAKDADLAWGCASPGEYWPPSKNGFRSMPEFLEQIREIVRCELVDILLASPATQSILADNERLYDATSVTPAVRANDTTDVWRSRGATYRDEPSRPFAACTLAELRGHLPTRGAQERPAVNLGLYSLTFNNRAGPDCDTLEAFHAFRREAERTRFRYFAEFFPPNIEHCGVRRDRIAAFLNDNIARTLAGIPVDSRPLFLKLPYLGARAFEELRNYDPALIIGVLGGGSGTTHDAFKLLADAKRNGARCALFGRKIKDAEYPMGFLEVLRAIADADLPAREGVKLYHDRLRRARISPKRPLKDDLVVTFDDLTYTRL